MHDFSVTTPRCCANVYVNSFFFGSPRLWNYLPAECFPLIYDLNGFKLIVTIFIWILSKQNFLCPLYSFSSFSCNSIHTSLLLFNYAWSETQFKREAVTLQKISWERISYLLYVKSIMTAYTKTSKEPFWNLKV